MWPHLYWQSWYIMQTLWSWLYIGIPLTWKWSSTKVVHNTQILLLPTRCANLIYMRTHTSIYKSEVWPCIWSCGICRKLTQVSAKSTGNRGKCFPFPSNRTGKIIHKGLKINHFLEKFKCNSVILHPAHYCFRATMHNIHIACIMVFHYLLVIKLSINKKGELDVLCLFGLCWFLLLLFVFGLTEFPLIKTKKIYLTLCQL